MDKIVYLFGRKVRIVEDSIGSMCNDCALEDICDKITDHCTGDDSVGYICTTPESVLDLEFVSEEEEQKEFHFEKVE